MRKNAPFSNVFRFLVLISALSACLSLGACGGQHAYSTNVDAFESGEGLSIDYPAGDAHLMVFNNSADIVVGVYMNPSNMPSSVTNLANNHAIPIGRYATISGLGAGTWDIRIQDAAGKTRLFKAQKVKDKVGYSLLIDAYAWQ